MAGNPNPKIKAANEGLTIVQGGNLNWTGKVRFVPERLEIPLRKKKPTMYFVNSLSDLFHEDIPDEQILGVFNVIQRCPHHTFQILTKRAKNMRRVMSEMAGKVAGRWIWPLPNVWLGVSVEDQQRADERIPYLLQAPAAVRFLSCEPMLGPMSFRWAKWHDYKATAVSEEDGRQHMNHLDGIRGIDWVIVGGESGKNARPMHPDWPRAIRDECQAAGVPFFFKQWGSWWPLSRTDGVHELPLGRYLLPGEVPALPKGFGFIRVGKKRAGELLDGRKWQEMPEARR